MTLFAAVSLALGISLVSAAVVWGICWVIYFSPAAYAQIEQGG